MFDAQDIIMLVGVIMILINMYSGILHFRLDVTYD